MGYIWVRSYKGLSFVEKQQNDGSHEQGSHSAKNGASSWAKNTLIPQNSLSIMQICPNIWDIVEKKLHWASVVHGRDKLLTRKLFPGCASTIYSLKNNTI